VGKAGPHPLKGRMATEREAMNPPSPKGE